MSTTWTYPSVSELERLATTPGRDPVRERRENEEAMRLCDELEELDAERAADELELLAHKDDFGRPLPGHESPRYLDARQRGYREWLLSSAGDRTRRNAHPELEARLRRTGRTRSEPASFALRDAETR
jgi:hypothetical protein